MEKRKQKKGNILGAGESCEFSKITNTFYKEKNIWDVIYFLNWAKKKENKWFQIFPSSLH